MRYAPNSRYQAARTARVHDAGAVVPAALWARLRRLDRRCDFEIVRRPANAPRADGKLTSGKNYPREWVVRIRLTGERDGPSAEGATLAMVLGAAVAMAEEKGWHLPAA